jgi:DNA end-binding protein Ku
VPEDKSAVKTAAGLRTFWSGTISFGLVNVPVSLYPANRAKSVSLNMIDHDGTPLSRQYYCPHENMPVESDEIARGYEMGDNSFIIIEDDELEALEPKKSREIDLRRFVKVHELDPVYFERAYYLVPEGDSNKAYRLLARTMEKKGRAGIATFIMREKEYLVAIISEKGILRAETMRFHNEIRSPEDVGLPELREGPSEITGEFQEEIKKLRTDNFDPDILKDYQGEMIKKIAKKKLKEDKDAVIHVEPEESQESANVIDLMEILKQRLNQSKG